jgi:hypothetical protein
MIERFDYYDLLGVAISGVLLAYWVPVCFPAVTSALKIAEMPEAVDVIGFAAVAITLGHLIQALASGLERPLYRSWGGVPSDRAFSGGLGDRYVSAAAGARIRGLLSEVVGEDASNQDLFRAAQVRANAASASRAERFNALYGYHRSLMVVIGLALLLLVASRFWGAAATWSEGAFWGAVIAFLATLGVLWHRTRQRANHLVQEVLYVAERTLRSEPEQTSPRKVN